MERYISNNFHFQSSGIYDSIQLRTLSREKQSNRELMEVPLQNSQEELQESSDVVYAELDKSVLGSGTKPVDVESTTEYAEIIPQ